MKKIEAKLGNSHQCTRCCRGCLRRENLIGRAATTHFCRRRERRNDHRSRRAHPKSGWPGLRSRCVKNRLGKAMVLVTALGAHCKQANISLSDYLDAVFTENQISCYGAMYVRISPITTNLNLILKSSAPRNVMGKQNATKTTCFISVSPSLCETVKLAYQTRVRSSQMHCRT